MGKLVKILLSLVLVVGVIIVLNLGSGLKVAIESLGPEVTQSSVTLDKAEISLISGEGSLRGLIIGNPECFATERAFSLREISFTVDNDSLATDTIVVNSLRIVAPEVTLESGRKGSNLDRLQKNMMDYLRVPSSSTSNEDATKNIIIKELLITKGKMRYSFLGAKTVDLALSEIRLRDIGAREQGLSMAEAGTRIIGAMTSSASQAAVESTSVKDIGKNLEDQIKDKASGLKSLFKKQ
jgi:hypothetical protein